MPSDVQDLRFYPAQSREDISDVVNLHFQSFSDNLAGQIGHQFLDYYYQRILNLPQGAILICRDGKKLVGFVAGLSTRKGLYDIRFFLYSFKVVLYQIFVQPSILRNIFRYIKRALSHRESCEAELLAIAVDSAYRKLGIGKRLVHDLEKFFSSRHVAKYEVFTDTKFSSGVPFYEQLGFQLHQELRLFGMVGRIYFKSI